MHLVTFVQFAGGEACLAGFPGDVVRVLAAAYREYLSAWGKGTKEPGCAVPSVSGNIPVVGERKKVVAEDRASAVVGVWRSEIPGHTRVPSPTRSDFSGFTYTGSGVQVEPVEDYCYLNLFREDAWGDVGIRLGRQPSFASVLAQPLSEFSDTWSSFRVSRFNNVYHVAKQGMVKVYDCFATVAMRAIGWPPGSLGFSLVGMGGFSDFMLDKAPLLTDVLAGTSELADSGELRTVEVLSWNFAEQFSNGRCPLFIGNADGKSVRTIRYVDSGTKYKISGRGFLHEAGLDRVREYMKDWRKASSSDAPLTLVLDGDRIVSMRVGDMRV
jgi:hypothetical protein